MINWKRIPGSKFYFASECGKIGSLYKRGARGESCKVIRQLKPSVNKAGYEGVHLYESGKRYGEFVHRLVARTFIGKSNLPVNHKNLNKRDNRANNLEYVTHQENYDHARANGVMKMPPITGPARRKLTKRQVFSILGSKFGCDILGRKYKIQPSTIVKIRAGKAYKDWVNEFRFRT